MISNEPPELRTVQLTLPARPPEPPVTYCNQRRPDYGNRLCQNPHSLDKRMCSECEQRIKQLGATPERPPVANPDAPAYYRLLAAVTRRVTVSPEIVTEIRKELGF